MSTNFNDQLKRFQTIVIQNGNKKALSIALATTASLALGYFYLKSNILLPVPVALRKMKRNLGYLCNPGDIIAMFKFKIQKSLPQIPEGLGEDWDWCYKKLTQTSRSFSAVILELDKELREPVCLFYLVLRGLDTVEDDMKPNVDDKIKVLNNFYTYLDDPKWTCSGYGDKPSEIDLLENFDKVIRCLLTLDSKYFHVISDICKRMGEGMAKYLTHDVVTIENYEEYCHYVAGLVGYGLSGLFGLSGLEDERFGTEEFEEMSNSMGLFLQKTNIIRDLQEDITEDPPRAFWPSEVFEKYVPDRDSLLKWEHRRGALQSLNHLVTDGLKHAEDCLDYLKLLKQPSVFNFCAIPQVMAIATLELVYNNYDVFLYEVKIRKGEAVRIILESKNYKEVCRLFSHYANKIKRKIPSEDKNTLEVVERIISRCRQEIESA